jgi:hypothetical protein
MKAQKLSAAGAAPKPFANRYLSLLYPLPAGKGEGGSNSEFLYPDVLTPVTAFPLLKTSVPICVSSVAKAFVLNGKKGPFDQIKGN